jgi:hypothetical protein
MPGAREDRGCVQVVWVDGEGWVRPRWGKRGRVRARVCSVERGLEGGGGWERGGSFWEEKKVGGVDLLSVFRFYLSSSVVV